MAITPFWLWLGFTLFVLALLAFDLGVLHRRSGKVGVRRAFRIYAGYVALACAFGAGVFYFRGTQPGYEFFTAYLIELSLSLDNLFVFVLVFTHFAVPREHQHRVLFWGIIGALVMRGTMIYAGAALISAFEWVLLLFGAFLIVTGLRMLFAADAEPDLDNNRVIRFARRKLRVTTDFHGSKFFVRRDAVLWATPLFLVLILIELSDVVFALDSIPAVFAVTQDPFIVYTSNVFAILGLRALYFALAGVVRRFHYLKYGLALVLMVIGGKMLVNEIAGAKIIPTEAALALTAALILGSILVSFIRTRNGEGAENAASTGWLPGSGSAHQAETKPQVSLREAS